MKKVYYAPLIIVTEVVLEQGFLMDSAHGTSHEGDSLRVLIHLLT